MEEDARWFVPSDRPAGCQADDRGFVQRQDEPQVFRKTREKGDLRRPGIAEDRRQASLPEDVQCRISDASAGHAASIA
jgi:hypothetical protein